MACSRHPISTLVFFFSFGYIKRPEQEMDILIGTESCIRFENIKMTSAKIAK